jgi:hypothetical protein
MAEPARANMMAVRRLNTRNATRGQSDLLQRRRSRERIVFWAEERTTARASPARSAGTTASLRQSGCPSGSTTLQLSRHSSSMTNPSALRGSEASTRSTVLASSAGSTSGSDNSTSSTKTFGELAWNAARMEVSARVAASSVRPIRSRPERPCATSCTCRIVPSTCSSIRRASARNSLPADVSPARRWRWRASRLTPICSSSPATCFVSAG